MSERTPGPWELIEATEHHGAYIVNSWGRTICDLYAMSNPMAPSIRNGGTSAPVPFDDMSANAAFIVRACNAHDALVKALTDLCDEFASEEAHGDGAFDENCSACQAHQRARDLLAALAAAGAKK